MSHDYATSRIKQALELTRGNAAQARQQVIAWCHEDMKLLHALTRPHMTGIVAHAISRVMSGRTEPQEVPSVPEKDKKGASKGDFGVEILKTIAGGDTTQFGQENVGRPIGKRSASQQHIDAIQQMIDKSSSSKE